jgi:hypothetical protein
MNQEWGHNNNDLEHTGRTSFFATVLQVLLFPISPSGLTVIGIAVFLPPVAGFICLFIPFFGFILSLLVHIIVLSYFYWYVIFSVKSSAAGERRAPSVMIEDADYDIFSILWQFFQIFIPILLCLGPALSYWLTKKQTDLYFWLALAGGGFVLPIAILSVMMYDSLAGLNPFLLLISIVRAFIPYLITVLVFYIPVFVFAEMAVGVFGKGFSTGLVGMLLFRILRNYTFLTAAHAIGWFYYKNQERLRWDM